jgi:hypothetical protein
MKELQETVGAAVHGVAGTTWGLSNLVYNTARATILGVIDGAKSGVKSIDIQQLRKDTEALQDLAMKAKDAVGYQLSNLTAKVKAKASDIRAKMKEAGASKEQAAQVDRAVNTIVAAAGIKE